jgi:hypothetical protein
MNKKLTIVGSYLIVLCISLISGIMYMLASYATFSLANNIMFNKVNSPDFTIFFAGLIISLLGMVIGYLRSVISKRKSL